MRCSESWLREWINPNLSRDDLSHILTMAGLEVEEIVPVSEFFSGVVVGKVLKTTPHPEADKLKICEVEIGKDKPLQIVCGALNVKAGVNVPVALIDAVLPNDTIIKPTQIRGIASEGMLCSASELGMTDGIQDGLLLFSDDAPLGEDVRNYLKLDDYIVDISITPNRSDCLSVRGIARELAALTPAKLNNPVSIKPATNSIKDKLKVTLQHNGCPRYVGRVIRGVHADRSTPMWLQKRLRRSGVRCINPIVDVTNYVMMELGQPMHAFDLAKIETEINVRLSKSNEKIKLLDGSEKQLNSDTLVIADAMNPLAIAGVMGGIESGVTSATQDIFLESAYFSPEVIAKQRQFYLLNSESAYRFERGVDPTIQKEALEYATQLIIDLVGGAAGPIIEEINDAVLPKKKHIGLSQPKVKEILGIDVPNKDIEAIFHALNFPFTCEGKEWVVEIPAYRFDITVYEDLIEEIARIYGYDKIPTHTLYASLTPNHISEEEVNLTSLRQAFCDQDYHEIISYPFIDKAKQSLLDTLETPVSLVNPITNDMTVMRTNLWPGLIHTFLYNKSRQQQRIRLFEIGTCFTTRNDQLSQELKIGGLISGSLDKEQWGKPSQSVDFYDLKGDLEAIFNGVQFDYKPDHHPALHPGQAAGIYYHDKKIGLIGALHPHVLQSLDVGGGKAFVFELELSSLLKSPRKPIQELSKFPEIRRDIAILVNEAIPAADIQDTIKRSAGDWLKSVFIFDVYQGKGISPGLKSIALALVLQHPTRTLIDEEINELMGRVIETLKGKFQAELRS